MNSNCIYHFCHQLFLCCVKHGLVARFHVLFVRSKLHRCLALPSSNCLHCLCCWLVVLCEPCVRCKHKGIDLLVLCEVKTLSLPCLLDSNYLHHFCLWLVFELCEALTCYRVSCVVCEVETPSLPCLSKSKSSSSTLLLSRSYAMWTVCEVQVEHQLVVIHALCVKWELYHHTFWIRIASLFLLPWTCS